jgi:hypothetical protein
MMEEGHDVDIVYVDFAKAFDKVDINIAMRKIRSLGITGLLADWIHCFLTHRTQQVVVNSAKSKSIEVISGVPQGSVLGPLIFLILIGDIDKDIVTSFLSSFADDTRIGREVDDEEDEKSLQNDLEHVYDWCKENNMSFNSDKFQSMTYLHNRSHAEYHKSVYRDDKGIPIEKCDHIKDLGVFMSADGTFSHHINTVVVKSKHMCAWILRTFSTRVTIPMITLYKSMVLPHLDYCSQLWNPCRNKDIIALEQVQRNYIKNIKGMYGLNYWEQLSKLGLYSLQRRRERYAIMYLWKMLERKVPPVGLPVTYMHPRYGRLCKIPTVKSTALDRVKSIRYSSFPILASKLFNCLPESVRKLEGCSTECFKAQLDKFLKKVPDEPQIQGYTAMRRADSNSLLHMISLI